MLPISAVMIARNEELHIERSLRALAWCDELIVIDSGSSDRTREIAQSCRAKVIDHPFSGFGEQKRFAVSQATHDWVLSIDADEVVTPELAKEIRSTLSTSKDTTVYYLLIHLNFLGKDLHSYGPKGNVRLFNKKHWNFSQCAVHEYVDHGGEVAYLKNKIDHFSYDSIHDYLEKFNDYTTRAATQLFERNTTRSLWAILPRLPISFFRYYILEGHFRNGHAGLIWSVLSTYYPVVKIFKLYEMRLSSQKK